MHFFEIIWPDGHRSKIEGSFDTIVDLFIYYSSRGCTCRWGNENQTIGETCDWEFVS